MKRLRRNTRCCQRCFYCWMFCHPNMTLPFLPLRSLDDELPHSRRSRSPNRYHEAARGRHQHEDYLDDRCVCVCVCSLIVSVFVRCRLLVHVRLKLMSAVSLNTSTGWTFPFVFCLQALTHSSCSSCVSQRLWLTCLFVCCVSNNEQHLLPLLLWVCFPPDCGFLMCHPSPW